MQFLLSRSALVLAIFRNVLVGLSGGNARPLVALGLLAIALSSFSVLLFLPVSTARLAPVFLLLLQLFRVPYFFLLLLVVNLNVCDFVVIQVVVVPTLVVTGVVLMLLLRFSYVIHVLGSYIFVLILRGLIHGKSYVVKVLIVGVVAFVLLRV